MQNVCKRSMLFFSSPKDIKKNIFLSSHLVAANMRTQICLLSHLNPECRAENRRVSEWRGGQRGAQTRWPPSAMLSPPPLRGRELCTAALAARPLAGKQLHLRERSRFSLHVSVLFFCGTIAGIFSFFGGRWEPRPPPYARVHLQRMRALKGAECGRYSQRADNYTTGRVCAASSLLVGALGATATDACAVNPPQYSSMCFAQRSLCSKIFILWEKAFLGWWYTLFFQYTILWR
jgi:hypothetical protein